MAVLELVFAEDGKLTQKKITVRLLVRSTVRSSRPTTVDVFVHGITVRIRATDRPI